MPLAALYGEADAAGRLLAEFAKVGSVQNTSPNILYIGFDSALTTSNGTKLLPGDSWYEDQYTGAVWGIASAAASDSRWQEVG